MCADAVRATARDWEWRRLDEVCTLVTDGSHFSPIPQKSGRLIANVKDMRDGYIDFQTCTRILESDFQALKRQNCSPSQGDVLLSKDGTVGKVVVYNQKDEIVVLSSIAILRPSSLLTSEFLGHVLLSDLFSSQIDTLKSGSALRRIVLRDIASLRLPLPSLEDQLLIATILDSADSAIQQSGSMIGKLKQVKTGLMQVLLTCGIDEKGNIRNEDTHEFTDSPLGRIPKDWEQKKLQNVATIRYGINSAIDTSLKRGIKTITLPCVSAGGELDVSAANIVFTSETKVPDSLLLEKGDLLFNWRNGSQSHLGKTALFEEDGKYTHVGFLLRVRVREGKIDPAFLWWLINLIKMNGYFLTAKIQVNNTFNSHELAGLPVLCPPISEQKRIVSILSVVEHEIKKEVSFRMKLQALKQGLMQDLLSGKVRVNHLLKQ